MEQPAVIESNDNKPGKINCRPETRNIIERVSEDRGWTYTETLHRMATRFIERPDADRAERTTAA